MQNLKPLFKAASELNFARRVGAHAQDVVLRIHAMGLWEVCNLFCDCGILFVFFLLHDSALALALALDSALALALALALESAIASALDSALALALDSALRPCVAYTLPLAGLVLGAACAWQLAG